MFEAEQLLADRRTARVCAVLATGFVALGGGKKQFTEAEFMPKRARAETVRREQTPEEKLAIVEGLNIAFGGRDLRGAK